MTEQDIIRQYERANGVKPIRVTPPDEHQQWRTVRDPDGLFEIELKGWVAEGRSRQNGVDMRDFFAFDLLKSQSFTVTAFTLTPTQAREPEKALKVILDGQQACFQHAVSKPIVWQGYRGYECRGPMNPAVFNTARPYYARDLFVQGIWLSLRAESPNGPYDEVDVLRTVESLKILHAAP